MGRIIRSGPAAAGDASGPKETYVTASALAQARSEGFAAGHAAATAEAAAALLAADAEPGPRTEVVARTAVPLARKMAEKIVGHAVEVTPSIMADIVAEALARARAGAGRARVRLHSADRAAVDGEMPRIAARLAAGTLELVEDDRVGRYGCVVETARGLVDARLSTQLDALERALAREDGVG